MSGASSNEAAWFTLLEPALVEPPKVIRPDDPRLGEIIESWDGNLDALRPGRAVIVGFPQDEGVRRNGGRVGAAKAPDEIRKFLHRLTTGHIPDKCDLADHAPLDAGNVRILSSLEESQETLGKVVGEILKTGAVPIVLGGGHETAYGHYLGYVNAGIPVGIVNVDAHLDVRPCINGLGHSGSPFRQALEHPTCPLPGGRYSCLGAQPFAVSGEHYRYLEERGSHVCWASQVAAKLECALADAVCLPSVEDCRIFLTIDADAFTAADVPGVSAPNPDGFLGVEATHCTRSAGRLPQVASMELVEINPLVDIDNRSARWAAVVIWYFLVGLGRREEWVKEQR